MNIRTWIIFIINILVVLVVLFLSIIFYKEFSSVVENRVLEQLSSIKTLKQIQLEKLINSEWQKFQKDSTSKKSEIDLPTDDYTVSGIYDLTHLHPQKQTSIGFITIIDGKRNLGILSYDKIKNILLERTGMGLSGESYVVGSDYRLRSQSRFFPEKVPYNIVAKTDGVLRGLDGITKTGIFPDYRGIKVYSSYQPIEIDQIKWVILSEIDVQEVSIPLIEMRKKLILITLCIIVVAIFLSLFLTRIITKPIIEMKQKLMVMTQGDYRGKDFLESPSRTFLKKPKEIKEMFEALSSLKISLSGAVDFSVDIGNMNLHANYIPKSSDDLLGHTLLKMREKLIAYRNTEQQINLTNKRFLVERSESERKKLARDLHDGIGPLLTTLKLYVQHHIEKEKPRKEINKIIDATIAEVRLMTNALMPATLEDFGIGPTLKNYVQSINESIGIKINFEDSSKGNISNELAINLFRIVQELINNTIKHSNASQITITLSEFEDFISLYYRDNGGGFNIDTIVLGSGITNMKERVEIFNGKIDIQTNKGTTIFEIELPI